MNIKNAIRRLLPPRKLDSHKGDFGRVFILAGSVGMSGACVLAGKAALRSGAGLVTVGVPESLAIPLSRRIAAEAMTKPLPETAKGTLSARAYRPVQKFLKGQDVFALGPGLSQNPETERLIRKLVLRSTKSMVIDADGLNAFRGKAPLLRKINCSAVVTPHPGEFVRLFGGRIPKGRTERVKRSLEAARQFSVVVVLKGNQTVVASPEGNLYVNSTGNAGMATGGSGDVLLGVIAALLGQGLSPFDAAKAGVYLHGLAGDLARKKVGEISLMAGDLTQFLPQAFRKTLGR